MVKINKLYILYRIDYVFNKNEDILLVQRIKLIVNTMIRRKKSFWDVLWRALQTIENWNICHRRKHSRYFPIFPELDAPANSPQGQNLQCSQKFKSYSVMKKIVTFIICHMFQIMEFILYCIYLILNLIKFFIMSICSLRSCIGYILYHDCSFNGNSGKLGAMVVSKSTKEYKSSHHRESFYS